MGASKWFFSMSGVILLICALAIGGKGLNFGIDFESGTRVKTALTKPASEDDVRDVLPADLQEDAKIQKVSDREIGDNAFQISTKTLTRERVDEVADRARTASSASRTSTTTRSARRSARRSPTTRSSRSSRRCIVISAYIALRFEWKYAVPVLIALSHDLLITAGVYALVGREVTTSTVAALLTILGFSLYDTIIVFDRIRENVPRMPRAAFSQIVNRSMSEVLDALAGDVVLHGAAGARAAALRRRDAQGLRVRAASSASSPAPTRRCSSPAPVLTHWKEREPVYVRRRRRLEQEFGGRPGLRDDRRRRAGRRRAEGVQAPGAAASPRPRTRRPGSRGRSSTRWSATCTPTRRRRRPRPREPEADPNADAAPEDLVMKDDKPQRDKQRKPAQQATREGPLAWPSSPGS